jgi:hypothetical protein
MNAMMKPLEIEDESAELVGTLTDKQQAFVLEFVANGGQLGKAAEVAGYSYPAQAATGLVRLPHVAAAIRAETSRAIQQGAAMGVRFMTRALADDSKLSGAVKFQCAKWLAEAAGHGAPKVAADTDQKPQGEMSLADLDAFVTAGRAALVRARAEREAIPGEAQEIAHDDAARASLEAQGFEPS